MVADSCGKILDARRILHAAGKRADGNRHAEALEIRLGGVDAGVCRLVDIGLCNIPDAAGKAGKKLLVLRIDLADVSCPAAPERRKGFCMDDVKFLAQREADRVDRKTFRAAKSGQPVVRQTAAPHNFAHRIVIAGVINHSRSVCNRHAQHALGKLHRRFVSLNRVKIAL